jgi:multicomponent Na+:H+ antiporter subunit D
MVPDLIGPTAPWPILTVALPLFAGALAMVAGRHASRLAAPYALLAAAVAGLTVLQVWQHGVVEFAIGGHAPPLGIAIRVDGLAAAFLAVSAITAGVALLFARVGFGPADDGGETRAGYAFWPLAFLLVAGLNASFVGGDLFNLYVALELLTLTAVAMVSLSGKADALAAAFRYLLFALTGSLAYLAGAALLYAAHGTLDVRLLAERVNAEGPALIAGMLMTVGLMAKMALFPLHGWLPPAHASAPAAASALLSALVVKAPFVILLRLWFEVMPGAGGVAITQFLGLLGALGVVVGSVMALRQSRLKLVIAYSTVAQLGYLFLVFPLAGEAGPDQPWAAGAWTGVVLHAAAHAFAKSALFLAAGAFAEARGHDRLDGLGGVSRDTPMAAFAFGLAAVSIAGLPISGGFTAKYLLLTSAFAGGQWWWGLVLVGGGLIAAAYLFRVLNRIIAKSEIQAVAVVPRPRQALALMLAALAVLLGLLSDLPYQLLQIGRPQPALEGIA